MVDGLLCVFFLGQLRMAQISVGPDFCLVPNPNRRNFGAKSRKETEDLGRVWDVALRRGMVLLASLLS